MASPLWKVFDFTFQRLRTVRTQALDKKKFLMELKFFSVPVGCVYMDIGPKKKSPDSGAFLNRVLMTLTA